MKNNSQLIQDIQSQKKLHAELSERQPTINSQPRDWSKPIEDPVIFGVSEEPLQSIDHLIIRRSHGSVVIMGYFPEGPKPFEIFTTREKIDSFIEYLTEARNSDFPD